MPLFRGAPKPKFLLLVIHPTSQKIHKLSTTFGVTTSKIRAIAPIQQYCENSF